MTTSGLPPIDGNAWSAYTSEGRRHFDRVVRSRNVLVRNANDLVALLDDAEREILHALALMESGPVASPTLDARRSTRRRDRPSSPRPRRTGRSSGRRSTNGCTTSLRRWPALSTRPGR